MESEVGIGSFYTVTWDKDKCELLFTFDPKSIGFDVDSGLMLKDGRTQRQANIDHLKDKLQLVILTGNSF